MAKADEERTLEFAIAETVKSLLIRKRMMRERDIMKILFKT